MGEYSDREKKQIIRDYFGPEGQGEKSLCPRCGETLQFDSSYQTDRADVRIQVSCPDCQTKMTWEQTEPEQPWNPLHLEYFVERFKVGDVPRCPIDDCYVNYTEFSDGVLEFRCPCCNRRGKVGRPRT